MITGTPGTGKTTIAKQLAHKENSLYVSVNALVRREHLHKGYDRKYGSFVLDTLRVRQRLKSILSENSNVVIDTTYVKSVLPPIRNGYCIVLRLDPPVLYRRLRRRGWSQRKCWQNVEAELVDSVYIDAVSSLEYRRVFQVDTTHRSTTAITAICQRIIQGKMKHYSEIDWLSKYDPIQLQQRLE